MSSTGLVWDACGLLNLMATGCPIEILSSLGSPSFVVQKVLADEVLYLRPSSGADSNALERVDMTPILNSGNLRTIVPAEDEMKLFVKLAQKMDDGEAISLAVAFIRECTIVTDDRLAIRVAQTFTPHVGFMSTPGWVKEWNDQAQPDGAILEAVLGDINSRASFLPSKRDPLYGWWLSKLPSS